jgi:hypothetical protein
MSRINATLTIFVFIITWRRGEERRGEERRGEERRGEERRGEERKQREIYIFFF